jgi:predicted RNA-binding protein associated with RNAse of E/G family
MPTVSVHKLNTRGEITVTYTAELAERVPGGVLLEARWTRAPLPLGYTTFETGDRFVEWFYTDRWYNIFEVHAADGSLKGWYCNVAEPATITDTAIYCRDLLLDLWVSPHGTTHVLDEDEFAAETSLNAATRAAAERALNDLQNMVRERAGPFWLVTAARTGA